jgi:hypothetical protein
MTHRIKWHVKRGFENSFEVRTPFGLLSIYKIGRDNFQVLLEPRHGKITMVGNYNSVQAASDGANEFLGNINQTLAEFQMPLPLV